MKVVVLSDERGNALPVAIIACFGALIGGTIVLFGLQQLKAFVFIIWGTEGRDIGAAVEVASTDLTTPFLIYAYHTLPLLALGALVHSVSIAYSGKSKLTVCFALALLCASPTLWSLIRLVPAGQVAGVMGGWAIFVWVGWELVSWVIAWFFIWYGTNAVFRFSRR